MKLSLIFTLIMVPLVFISSTSGAVEIYTCSGDLLAFGYNGKKTTLLNNNFQPFTFEQKKILALAFSAGQKMPSVKVYPWNGIQWADISSRLKMRLSSKPIVETDGETWFAVTIPNELGNKLTANCKLR